MGTAQIADGKTDNGAVTATLANGSEQILDQLGVALSSLETRAEDVIAATSRVLRLRDQIGEKSSELSSDQWGRLINTDKALRQLSRDNVRFREAVNQAREAHGEVHEGWWWQLDKVEDQVSVSTTLLTLLSLLFFVVSITLATDIVRRFFTGGVDLVGIAGTAVQAFLTLLVGSQFTAAGRGIWTKFVSSKKVSSRVQARLALVLSALLFTGTTFLWLALPRISNAYVLRGKAASTSQAISLLRQAITVHPQNEEAHYELGFQYEQAAFSLDSEIEEYKAALALAPDAPYTILNLARCYLRKNAPSNVSDIKGLLGKIRSFIYAGNITDPEYLGSYYKNVAWMYLNEGKLPEAYAHAKLSLSHKPNAEAYAILAAAIQEKQGSVLEPKDRANWKTIAGDNFEEVFNFESYEAADLLRWRAAQFLESIGRKED